jgi:ribosomal-protein-alanine N-acetyltransferase
MRVQIAPMVESDIADVLAIEGASKMTEAQLREELERPWARLWAARSGSVTVAFLVAWHVSDELHVLNVATHPSHRRKGIGLALMEEALRFAQGKKVRHVLLEVRRSNRPAIALYRRLGFYAMGVRPRYYPDDEDAVEMVLLFEPDGGAVIAKEDEVKLEI